MTSTAAALTRPRPRASRDRAPSLPDGSTIYGTTKVFPDLHGGEVATWFTLVHGLAHEIERELRGDLQATRAQRKGFESAIYSSGWAR